MHFLEKPAAAASFRGKVGTVRVCEVDLQCRKIRRGFLWILPGSDRCSGICCNMHALRAATLQSSHLIGQHTNLTATWLVCSELHLSSPAGSSKWPASPADCVDKRRSAHGTGPHNQQFAPHAFTAGTLLAPSARQPHLVHRRAAGAGARHPRQPIECAPRAQQLPGGDAAAVNVRSLYLPACQTVQRLQCSK